MMLQDKRIRKFEFVAKMQFLLRFHLFSMMTVNFNFFQPVSEKLISLLQNFVLHFSLSSLNNLNKTDSQNHPSKMDNR